jgi:putative Mn2+ efflux pump MntP
MMQHDNILYDTNPCLSKVGMSQGISQRPLSWHANALISICNATGAWIASMLGTTGQHFLPPYMAPLLAAMAFGVLAAQEFWAFWKGAQQQQQQEKGEEQHYRTRVCNLDLAGALQLAVPMTFNNLAGGVAGTFKTVGLLYPSLACCWIYSYHG